MAAAGASRVRSVALALGVVVVVGVLVGWPAMTAGPDDPGDRGDADDEVTLPDADAPGDAPPNTDASGEVELEEDDPTERSDAEATDLDCQPSGCARWRIDEAELGHRYVDEDALVYVGDEVFTILDLDSAELLFTGQVPLPDGIDASAPPQAVQRLGGLLVLAYGDRLVAVELLSNRRAWSVDLDGSGVHRLGRHEGALLAIGSGEGLPVHDGEVGQREDVGDPPTHMTTTLASISPDGAVRWQYETETTPILRPVPIHTDGSPGLGPLVTVDDDELTRISLSDGEPRWQRALTPDERIVGGFPLTVVDDAAGSAEVLDVDSGDAQLRLHQDGIRSVQDLGSWLQVNTESTIHVHERTSGRELFQRDLSDGIDPGRPATAEVIDDGDTDRIAVAWHRHTRGAGPRIEILGPDGVSHGTVDIDLPAADDRIRPGLIRLEALDADRLQVVVEGGRTVAEVDVQRVEVVRSTSWTVPSDADVMVFGEVSVIEDGGELLVLGAGGQVQVQGGAPILEHPEPLLVGDGTQLLRIDEDVLDGRGG